MTNLANINESTNAELAKCINKFNQSLCRDRKTEIVHKVYDLGYSEIAEALGASIHGQTVNLRFLLGDYEVSDENNFATESPKPNNQNRLMKIVLAAILALFVSTSIHAQSMSIEKVDNQLHLALGMVAGSGTITFNEKVLDESVPNVVAAVGSAFMVGFIKEVYDANQPYNQFNWAEVGWTVIGGAVSYGLHELGVPDYITFGVGLSYGGIRMTF